MLAFASTSSWMISPHRAGGLDLCLISARRAADKQTCFFIHGVCSFHAPIRSASSGFATGLRSDAHFASNAG